MLRIVEINFKKRRITDEQLKKALLYRLKKNDYIRVHWGGSSGCPKLLKDGRIEEEGRLGGREMAEKEYFKDFSAWYEESVLLDKNKISLSLENAQRLGDKIYE